MDASAPPPRRKAFFGWASLAAPFVGALAGAPLGPGTDWRLNAIIGLVVASAPALVCVAVSIFRRERPWAWWVAGLVLNIYPFLLLTLAISVQLGITRIHM